MKKRLIALLLAGTMALSLAACGSGDNTGSSAPSGSTDGTQQSDQGGSTPDGTTPEGASPEVTAPPLKYRVLAKHPCLPIRYRQDHSLKSKTDSL